MKGKEIIRASCTGGRPGMWAKHIHLNFFEGGLL